MYVQEVYPVKELTILPGASPFVTGLINVRRKILSVINLKILLHLPNEQELVDKVIILEDQEMEFAILTDSIEGIHSSDSIHLLSEEISRTVQAASQLAISSQQQLIGVD